MLHSAPPKGHACVSGTSSCVLVVSREALHGCMGGNGHGYHYRQKGGLNPPFISETSELYLSCSFCCILVLWQSNKDGAHEGTAELNICGRSDDRLTAAMVHYNSLLMVLCLDFRIFCVSRRSRARGSFSFVRFRTVQYWYAAARLPR